ncbi:MAG: asparagine synthase, glutamine-hydrolyzing [Gemmatimonadetes bacterium]|nr:asparagine synthase, glutamine-hydrolyzing [Gemmatimonadota bacterium]
MCGIAGFWSSRDATIPAGVLERMTACVAHRGPDDDGHFRDEGGRVALGHRRLSIVDLSPEGHQPMVSTSGRFVIVFNGEIYNYRRLADELRSLGVRFRGHSDTEVMLAAFEARGLEAAVRRFVGIFAFALWDKRERTMHLVRDHLGVKPLYYGRTRNGLVFASELRPIEQFPGFEHRVDRRALTLLLRHNCIPAPYSIYEQVWKLSPGHILTIADEARELPASVPYWSAALVAQEGQGNVLRLSDKQATDALDELLRDAIALEMVADVPLGAFLSGGIDSSTVVALMQAQSSRPVRTFSIGFSEDGYNEAHHARAVASHLGTEHTELYVTPQHALEIVPRLPQLFDEPFSDSSQIPTFLVSQMARQHVTVALSGDGGDELFAGYNRHVHAERMWKMLRHTPANVRRFASRAIRAVSPSAFSRGAQVTGMGTSRLASAAHAGHYMHKLADVLGASGPGELYFGLASHWTDPSSVVLGGSEPPTRITDRASWPNLPGFTEQMLYFDLVTYLPDDILTKVDRASMAVGLEARVPLLDHRVVKFAWTLPTSMKLRAGRGKWLLREVLARYVPPSLTDRPKSGFGIPLGPWLRGPLRDWAESLLDEHTLAQEGFFDPAPIRRVWAEHLSGRLDRQFLIWDVLMFQAWHRARRDAQ